MENESRPPTQTPFASLGNALLVRRGLLLVIILVVALIGFEMFNYSTTDYALADLLGDMSFAGVHWSTILALAFCGIDFAGIARLFTPDTEMEGGKEVWYLFAAWLLAATLNALLTWWGVAMALSNRSMMSTAIVDQNLLSRAVPIFVACVVWITRILLISNLTSSTARLFQQPAARPQTWRTQAASDYEQPRLAPRRAPAPAPVRPAAQQPREQPASRPYTASSSRPQPGATRPQPASRTPAPASHPTPRPATQPYSRPAPQPAPKPAQVEPDPSDDNMPPEPEYIPDPGYAPFRPSYHSLSARANPTGKGSRQV